MARYRKLAMCSAVALAISLTACGEGTTNVASAPPPPTVPVTPPPPPPPPPPPTPAGIVGAAAQAQVPNANQFPVATNGGPTLEAHSTTGFPLLETVMKIENSTAVADVATISGGATLTSTGGNNQNDFSFAVAALGISVPLGSSFYYSGLFANVGNTHVELYLDDSTKTGLSWSTYGAWAIYEGDSKPARFAAFVTGYRTPLAAVPKTGTATFTGSVTGQVFYPQAGGTNGIGREALSGDAALQANFGSGTITGSLTNMRAGSDPWNSVSLQGTISTAANAFSGASTATSAPGGVTALSSAATGTFSGLFFGPIAQELGAVWTLFDGTKTATGAFGAKSGP